MKNRSSTKTIKSCKFPPTNVLCKNTNRTVFTFLYRLTQKESRTKPSGIKLDWVENFHNIKQSLAYHTRKKNSPTGNKIKILLKVPWNEKEQKAHRAFFFFEWTEENKKRRQTSQSSSETVVQSEKKTEILCRKIQFLLSLFLIPPRNSGY